MAQKDYMFQICDEVRECSFALHKFVRHGHKGKIDENGFANRLQRQGIEVAQQPSVSVFDDDGTLLDTLDLDLLVVGELVFQLKAVKRSSANLFPNSWGISEPLVKSTSSSLRTFPRPRL